MDMDLLLLQFGTVARENMEQKIFVQMAECFELKEMVCSFLLDGKIPRLRSSKISLLQDFMRLVLLVGLCFITQFLSAHAVVDYISQTAWVLCFAHFDH
jgi:hypothetical protein